MSKTREELMGFEYDWLACDASGNVALFSTAGGGYVPEEFLHDVEAHDEAIEAILSLPPSTEAKFYPEVRSGVNTWRLVAQRGLFAFDSDPEGGPYRMVAAPSEAVDLRKLVPSVTSVAGRIVLGQLNFADIRLISSELLQLRGR